MMKSYSNCCALLEDFLRYLSFERLSLLPNTSLDTARSIAEELIQTIHDLPADPVQGVSASLGVASTCTQPLDLNALMNSADKALYQAKASGRNQVAVVD